MSTNQTNLDDILTEVGDFGKYQFKIVFFISLAAGIVGFSVNIWIFETMQLNYRCEITGCETDPMVYKPSWWTDAIPLVDNEPSKCQRYKLLNNSNQLEKCMFDKNVVEVCNKHVYETTKTTVLRDFNLNCNENMWKLTLVGTVNSAGLFVGLPISGMLSDKFGRKMILISGVALSAVMGITRSFATSYIFYTIMIFVDAVCRAGTYPACIIIGSELVRPNKRPLVNVITSAFGTFLSILVNGVAWAAVTWRTLDQVLYGVSFVILLYYWIIPESVRWLLTAKKYTNVEEILQKVAKTNGTTLSQESLEKLWDSTKLCNPTKSNNLKELLESYALIKRVIICSICWVCGTFAVYGLTVNSVTLSENKYLDITLVMLVDIPASITLLLLLNRIGRRICMAIGFFVCSVSCLSFIFAPEDLYWLRLFIYIFGKFGANITLSVMYIMASELFPTTLRSSLLSFCSMTGRIGAMAAPQTPLLALYWEPFPLALFTATSIIGGILCLLLPETMHKTLPDTIKDLEMKEKA